MKSASKRKVVESKDEIEEVELLKKKQMKINSSIKYRENYACRRYRHLGLICIAR